MKTPTLRYRKLPPDAPVTLSSIKEKTDELLEFAKGMKDTTPMPGSFTVGELRFLRKLL